MCVSYTSRWGSIISCGWCLDARRVVVWTWGHYILCSPKEKSKWDTMGDTCPNQPGYSWLLCTTYAYYASQDLDIMYKSVCGIIWIPSLLSNIQELFHLLHVLTMKHSKTTLLYHLQLWAILHQSYEWETATTFQPGFFKVLLYSFFNLSLFVNYVWGLNASMLYFNSMYSRWSKKNTQRKKLTGVTLSSWIIKMC